MRSSLVTGSLALHNSYQLRPDIALTGPERAQQPFSTQPGCRLGTYRSQAALGERQLNHVTFLNTLSCNACLFIRDVLPHLPRHKTVDASNSAQDTLLQSWLNTTQQVTTDVDCDMTPQRRRPVTSDTERSPVAAWALLALAAICGLLTVATSISKPDMHVCGHRDRGDLPVSKRTILCAPFFRPAALQAITKSSHNQPVFLQGGSVRSW